MLHFHNGDSSAALARRAGIPGTHLAWREALSHGPTPAVDHDHWLAVRAAHLSDAYGPPVAECRASLELQERELALAHQHEEVVIWVEHDLLCQLTAAYLLDAFARRVPAPPRLSLVCIGAFPGISDFRGLGQLQPEQLASLFPSRWPVDGSAAADASEAWRAYTADDPTALAALAARPSDGALRFLGPAFGSHLRRFPSTGDGLGCVERCALEGLAAGPRSFADLFGELGRRERFLGFADAQFLDDLRRLARAPVPFLVESGDAGAAPPACVYELAGAGRAALGGRADFVALNGIDMWLGGVRLRDGESVWRRDRASGALLHGLQ